MEFDVTFEANSSDLQAFSSVIVSANASEVPLSIPLVCFNGYLKYAVGDDVSSLLTHGMYFLSCSSSFSVNLSVCLFVSVCVPSFSLPFLLSSLFIPSIPSYLFLPPSLFPIPSLYSMGLLFLSYAWSRLPS